MPIRPGANKAEIGSALAAFLHRHDVRLPAACIGQAPPAACAHVQAGADMLPIAVAVTTRTAAYDRNHATAMAAALRRITRIERRYWWRARLSISRG